MKVRVGTIQQGQPSLLDLPVSYHRQWPPPARLIVECSRWGARGTFPVSACNSFINRNHPTIREMEDVAWVLRSDPRRNQVGFVRASQLKPGDRYVLPDEWD